MATANPLPEPHYSPRTLAECWNLSEATVLRWFQDMEGVLKCAEESSTRRTRCEIRIPKSIAERVYREKTKGRAA